MHQLDKTRRDRGRRGVRAALTTPKLQCPRHTPRDRRPHRAAAQDLTKRGLDAGADTIAAHLSTDSAVPNVPAVCTAWRILARPSTHGQLRERRRELNALMSIAHHDTGKPHGWIHNELRRVCGGRPVAAATTDQLKARIEAVRDL